MGLGDKMFTGMAWSAVERISMQTVQFIIGIILARILTPEEYGIIGILYVFIVISQVFIDSGFTKALIQRQNRTDTDISTVFFFNIGISLCSYIILWIFAPFAQQFYEIEELALLLRVIAISLIINSLYTIPVTLYTIKLDFKVLSKVNFSAALISGCTAVYLAYSGYGVWALVGQWLIRSIITALIIWFRLKWRPKWVFSKESLSQLFSYGSNLLVSSLLNTGVNKSYELVIAKVSSTQDLGYYTRGTQFTDFVFGIVASVINRVLLPGLASIQDQREILINHVRSIIKMTSMVIIPIFLLLAIMAEPIIRVILTDKWLPAVPIMQIFCIARLITIISTININLLYIIGRTDLALKQQYVKIGVRVVFFLLAFRFGIVYIAFAELASTIIHFFINTYHPGKIMKYGALSQIKDILRLFIFGILIVILSYILMQFISNDILKICVIPLLAVIVYVILLYLFKIPEYFLLLGKVRSLVRQK